jgi:hypothetical protein
MTRSRLLTVLLVTLAAVIAAIAAGFSWDGSPVPG